MGLPTLPDVGTEKVTGFTLQSNNPIDAAREWAANEAARLNIEFPYYGLHVVQGDTGQVFRYINNTTYTNVLADWVLISGIYSGTGAPAGSFGAIGDLYIREDTKVLYKKTLINSWDEAFRLSGTIILYGTGVPVSGLGEVADSYIDVNNGDLYEKTDSTTWTFRFNIKGTAGASGDRYATTTSVSINLNTLGSNGSLVVETGLAYTAGQSIIVVSRANPTVNFFTATVTSYNDANGLLNFTDSNITGTATATDWDVNLQGAPGRIGKAFIHIQHDINLTDYTITSAQASGYTKEDPYTASVLNDTRTNKTIPSALLGNMSGHSIAWDGNQWYDNGVWRGPAGPRGANGTNGTNGAAGTPGTAIVRHYTLTPTQYSFTIPTETSIGFYEVHIQIPFKSTSVAANRVTITLPAITSDSINYRVIIHREASITEENISPLRVQQGSGAFGVYTYNPSIGHLDFNPRDYYNKKEGTITFVHMKRADNQKYWVAESEYSPNSASSVKVGGFKALVARHGSTVLDATSNNHADFRTTDGTRGLDASEIIYPIAYVGIAAGELRIKAETRVLTKLFGNPNYEGLLELYVRDPGALSFIKRRSILITLPNTEGWNDTPVSIDYYSPDIAGGTVAFYFKCISYRNGVTGINTRCFWSRSASYTIDYNKITVIN